MTTSAITSVGAGLADPMGLVVLRAGLATACFSYLLLNEKAEDVMIVGRLEIDLLNMI